MLPLWSSSNKSFNNNIFSSSVPYIRPLQREGGPTPKITVAPTILSCVPRVLLTTPLSPPKPHVVCIALTLNCLCSHRNIDEFTLCRAVVEFKHIGIILVRLYTPLIDLTYSTSKTYETCWFFSFHEILMSAFTSLLRSFRRTGHHTVSSSHLFHDHDVVESRSNHPSSRWRRQLTTVLRDFFMIRRSS